MKRIDNFITEIIGDLSPTGRLWAKIGLAVLFFAAWMSFDFGYSVSFKHGAFLALLSVVTAFGPEVAYKMWKEGRKPTGLILAAICVPLFAIEFYSHAGYTAGLRGHNISEAKVQNVKYDGAQEAAKEDKANLEMWKDHLNKLMAENAWAATVKADGLRAQLDAAQKAIDLEAARGGCKTKCQVEMKKKADIETRIAIAERATDLTNKIEATQRILDKKRAVADTTEHKSSPVVHQNEFLANVVALVGQGSLQPTAFISTSAQQSVNIAMAMVGTGLPGLAIFISGLFRRKRAEADVAPLPPVIHSAPVKAPAQAGNTTFIQKLDGYIPFRNPETLEFSNRRILPAQAAA